MKPKKLSELVLSILIVIYIVMDYKLIRGDFIGTIWGKIIMTMVVIYILRNCDAILGILSVILLVKIISEKGKEYIPSEEKKHKAILSFNKIHKTLEEEIVSKLKPLGAKITKTPYQPVLTENHNAGIM